MYIPGLDRNSYYKGIWIRHWQGFQGIYNKKYSTFYGQLDSRKYIEVGKLIRCGKFSNGFIRHTCPECGTILIVPFSRHPFRPPVARRH
ncbi:hypothetical protein ACFL20_01445 [Spirochaetota bacterium]